MNESITEKIDTGFAEIALYLVERFMKNKFPTVSLASIRARRGDGPAAFAAMAACFTIFTLAGTACAATLTVTNLNDSGAGSLRDSIASASPGDTIQFQVTGTITLTSGELLIAQSLTITGPGASQLAISGNHASRVIEIAAGAPVSLSGLTIENGAALDGATPHGGGILNQGTLTITNSTIAGNSTVSGSSGGGIANQDGTLTLESSTVTGNSSTNGGGIANLDGALAVNNSTLSYNSSVVGGGIFNHSSFSGFTMTNSTLYGNSASNSGAIRNESGRFTIVNNTVVGNSGGSTGGIENDELGQSSTISHTLLANNGRNCALSPPFLTVSLGYNLSDENSCAPSFTATGDQNNVGAGAGLDPKGLQANGGPTQTVALLPTSLAVDAIPTANCTDASGNPLTADQRGVTRPQGKGCDIGAYELVQAVPFASFKANLVIATGKIPGFALNSSFTLSSGSPALQPLTQTVTLQIANYTLTLPAGSLHPLWNGTDAPLVYDGTVNGAHLVIALISLGNNTWSFNAAGTPVTISAANPVPVTLTIGQNTGATSAQAIIQ